MRPFMISAGRFLYFSLFFMLFCLGDSYAQGTDSSKRPYYEYKGNYGEKVTAKKSKFKNSFGYELIDLGRNWSPVEIDMIHAAFEKLPSEFYNIPILKRLYRLEKIMLNAENASGDDIPAATLPSFSTIYENLSSSYKVFVEKQELRVEFYNPLFHEDRVDLINIIQHEMAHAFDFSKDFLSFSDEWIALTKFKVLHIYALDGRQDSDSLYALINDPDVNNYAPTATRNLSTYSRQNPQEDFANSVTAYINYPYFRYTHPARYKFLKKNVFNDKEYFLQDNNVKGFEEKVISDLDNALNNGLWEDVRNILIELSRVYFPELEKEIISRIKGSLGTMSVSPQKDKILGLASCFLMQPESLELRKNLIRSRRISVKEFLKDPRCFRHARDTFEKNISKWSPSNLYFYKEDGVSFIQFIDSALTTAHIRGFDTQYFWKIFIEGGRKISLAEGNTLAEKGGNGSVRINLMKSADKEFKIPEGEILRVELMAKRSHSRNFQSFESERTGARFIVQPWFSYIGSNQPKIRVVSTLASPTDIH